MSQNSHVSKLPNAPLKEVIFDIRWELDFDNESNKHYDSKFDLALGKFHNLIKKDFNKVNRIVPPFVPKEFANYIPQFQFLNKDKKYPLIQIGEGILSINDTDLNYEWKKQFSPLIKKTLQELCKSYDDSIEFNRVSLRYIDVVNLNDIDSKDYINFLAENLNFKVQKNFNYPGELSEFNYNEKFKLPNDDILRLNFSTAIDNSTNTPQLFWQYVIYNENKQSREEIIDWAEKAHGITSNLFRTMLKQEFYDSFTKVS